MITKKEQNHIVRTTANKHGFSILLCRPCNVVQTS